MRSVVEFVTFPCAVLTWAWDLIVSIPYPWLLTYFDVLAPRLIRLKTLLQQGISEPVFMATYYINLKELLESK